MKAPLFSAWFAATLLCAWPVDAQQFVPRKLSLQGVIRDGDGALQSRPTNVTVRFFTQETGGSQVGDTSGPIDVAVTDGLFIVEVPVEPSQWTVLSAPPWLELTVGDDKYSRQALTSVPYALASASAEQLSTACNGCVKDVMVEAVSATKITDVLAVEHGGTGVSALESWHPASFNPPWINYEGSGSYELVSFTKDPFGIVRLRGLAAKPAEDVTQDVFTLPPGYVPARREVFIGIGHVGTANIACRIDVLASGVVHVDDPCKAAVFLSLASIQFQAAAASP